MHRCSRGQTSRPTWVTWGWGDFETEKRLTVRALSRIYMYIYRHIIRDEAARSFGSVTPHNATCTQCRSTHNNTCTKLYISTTHTHNTPRIPYTDARSQIGKREKFSDRIATRLYNQKRMHIGNVHTRCPVWYFPARVCLYVYTWMAVWQQKGCVLCASLTQNAFGDRIFGITATTVKAYIFRHTIVSIAKI